LSPKNAGGERGKHKDRRRKRIASRRLGGSLPVAAQATEAESGCFLDGGQHFLLGWQGFALLGHYLAVHGNRELAAISVDHLDIDPRLLL
jgi:hypothetical protein